MKALNRVILIGDLACITLAAMYTGFGEWFFGLPLLLISWTWLLCDLRDYLKEDGK